MDDASDIGARNFAVWIGLALVTFIVAIPLALVMSVF